MAKDAEPKPKVLNEGSADEQVYVTPLTQEEVNKQIAEAAVPAGGKEADGKGMEHWGEGGTFRINESGERVRTRPQQK